MTFPRIRIGVDARTLTLPELRGMGSYLFHVLQAWTNAGDHFVLFTENPPRPDRLPRAEGMEWRQVSSPPGSRVQIWDWYALPGAVRREKLDIFWSPANRAFPLISKPQIVTVHDTLLQEKVFFSDSVESFYFRTCTPFLLRTFADAAITVSRFSAERIGKILRYPKRKIRVIPNGVSMPERPFDSSRAALRFLSDQKIVGRDFIYALGAESPWKNTRGLLKAFQKVLPFVPDAFLVVSGIQGKAFESFVQYCRELGISKSVKLMGFLNQKLRDALYQGATFFVYASLFEGFGLPPLEAMALGTPVLASNAASIPEATGSAAMQVDAADADAFAAAMVEMLREENKRRWYGSLGEKRVPLFRWDQSAREHREWMKETLGC